MSVPDDQNPLAAVAEAGELVLTRIVFLGLKEIGDRALTLYDPIWCYYSREIKDHELGRQALKALVRTRVPAALVLQSAKAPKRIVIKRLRATFPLTALYTLNLVFIMASIPAYKPEFSSRDVLTSTSVQFIGLTIALLLVVGIAFLIRKKSAISLPEAIEAEALRILFLLHTMAKVPSTPTKPTSKRDQKRFEKVRARHRRNLPKQRRYCQRLARELAEYRAIEDGFDPSAAVELRYTLECRLLVWCALQPAARLNYALEVVSVILRALHATDRTRGYRLNWLDGELVESLPGLNPRGLLRIQAVLYQFFAQPVIIAAVLGLSGAVVAAMIGLLK